MPCRMLLACLIAAFSIQCGCSDGQSGPATFPAKGILTLDGNPVEGATIVFVAMDGSNASATGVTDASGAFSMDLSNEKTGALPGTYSVIITKNEEIIGAAGDLEGEEAEHASEGEGSPQVGVRNTLPKKYQQPSPDFQFTVPDGGVTDLKIELTSN